jgi:hypothetical protein
VFYSFYFVFSKLIITSDLYDYDFVEEQIPPNMVFYKSKTRDGLVEVVYKSNPFDTNID